MRSRAWIALCGFAIAISLALWSFSGGDDEPAALSATVQDDVAVDAVDGEQMAGQVAVFAVEQPGKFQMTVLSSKIHDGQIAVLDTTTGHCWLIDTENQKWRDMGQPPEEDEP
jgi:hypothetical protein